LRTLWKNVPFGYFHPNNLHIYFYPSGMQGKFRNSSHKGRSLMEVLGPAWQQIFKLFKSHEYQYSQYKIPRDGSEE
jgi:hypothetical protein